MYRKMSCGFQSATVSSYMTVEEKLEEQGAGWFSFESTPKKKKKDGGGASGFLFWNFYTESVSFSEKTDLPVVGLREGESLLLARGHFSSLTFGAGSQRSFRPSTRAAHVLLLFYPALGLCPGTWVALRHLSQEGAR